MGLTALTLENQFWQGWVDAFEPTRIERRLVTLAVPAIQELAVRHPSVSYAVVRSLGDHLTDASLGLVATVVRLARDELRGWLRAGREQ